MPIDTVLEIPIPDTKPATEFPFGRFVHGERFEHEALPGFTLDLAAYFSVMDDYGL